MTKLCLTFMAGVSTSAFSIYLSGGSSRAMFCYGFILCLLLVLLLVTLYPKAIARVLWGTASAVEDFRASYKGHAKRINEEIHSAPSAPSTDLAIVEDVVGALAGMGMKRAEAKRKVSALIGVMKYEQFDALMRDALKVGA